MTETLGRHDPTITKVGHTITIAGWALHLLARNRFEPWRVYSPKTSAQAA